MPFAKISLILVYHISTIFQEILFEERRSDIVENETDKYIFRASITLKNGKTIYAFQDGLKAFKIRIK